jgi:hypothetical protein
MKFTARRAARRRTIFPAEIFHSLYSANRIQQAPPPPAPLLDIARPFAARIGVGRRRRS